MSQMMRTPARSMACARAIGPSETRQRTITWSKLQAQRNRDESAPCQGSSNADKRTDDASSPRTTVSALSKDETFIGLIIVTAIMSTNRFFKMFAELLDAAETEGPGNRMSLTPRGRDSTDGSIELPSASTSQIPGLPEAGTMMKITMQPSTGLTQVSLSSDANASNRSGAGEPQQNERYQGFFDVAATAVFGTVTGDSQSNVSPGNAEVGVSVFPDGKAPLSVDRANVNSRQVLSQERARRTELWTSASESRRTGRDKVDEITGGAAVSNVGAKSPAGAASQSQQRPGARRSLGMPDTAAGQVSGTGDSAPAAASVSSPSSPSAPPTVVTSQRPGARRALGTDTSVPVPAKPTPSPSTVLTVGKTKASTAADHSSEDATRRTEGATGSAGEGTATRALQAGGDAMSNAPAKPMSKASGSTGTASSLPSPSKGVQRAPYAASEASGSSAWPERVWPQPPPPLGDMRQPSYAAATTGVQPGGGGSGSLGGGGSGRGGDGRGGGGSGSSGEPSDGSGGRFPWVPVVFFLLAAATYPILRDANESRQHASEEASSDLIAQFLTGLSDLGGKLVQPLREGDRDSAALRTAQQDAYAVKVAEHRADKSGSDGHMLTGVGKRLPSSWGATSKQEVDADDKDRTAWWLVLPILLAAGAGAYALCSRRRKGNAGDDVHSSPGSADRADIAGGTPDAERSASGYTSHTADHSILAPASEGQKPWEAPRPATSAHSHDELPDPRHVRHVNVSQSFMSAANAFQSEE
eukprot:jgi/Ulvmu1/5136/UM021_0153.1